jgi:hypothetical protein
MSESMKSLVWRLVLLSNERCRLENEKNAYEGSVAQVSEQSHRKSLYQRIVAAFPDGWMNSGHISRDGECLLLCYLVEKRGRVLMIVFCLCLCTLVSAMKKRLEREQFDAEAQ